MCKPLDIEILCSTCGQLAEERGDIEYCWFVPVDARGYESPHMCPDLQPRGHDVLRDGTICKTCKKKPPTHEHPDPRQFEKLPLASQGGNGDRSTSQNKSRAAGGSKEKPGISVLL